MKKGVTVASMMAFSLTALLAGSAIALAEKGGQAPGLPGIQVSEWTAAPEVSAASDGPVAPEIASVVEQTLEEHGRVKGPEGVVVAEENLSPDGFLADGRNDNAFMGQVDGFTPDGRPIRGALGSAGL